MSKYNVGDKFIVEIDSEVYEGDMANLSPKYYTLKGLSGLAIIEKGIDKLQKCETELSWDEAYIKGLEDAWELARKIFTTDCETLQKLFGHSDEGQIIMTVEPQEALAKLEAYEKEQEKVRQKIMVGDIITLEDGTKGVVMDEDGVDNVVIFTENGCIEAWMNKKYITKTGKHIDIQSVLEQIKE